MNTNHITTSKSRLQKYLLPSLQGRGRGVGLQGLGLRGVGLLLLLSFLTFPSFAATEVPEWQIDWSYTQTRPDWQEPAAENFENWMVMLIGIEDALLPYVSENDLLAIFIGDEMRGLARPSFVVSTSEVDATRYLLKVYGNENYGDRIDGELKYYNAQLGQVFTLSETITLDENALVGLDEEYIPPFTLGSPKYPVVTTVNANEQLTSAGITPAEGDLVAAFVGDECRGVSEWSATDNAFPTLNVFQTAEGEEVVLKYYDASEQRIRTLDGSATEEVVTGDATGDGVVDVSDYIGIANYILGNAPEGFNEKAADVNGDGIVDVSDYIGVANIILYGNVKGK